MNKILLGMALGTDVGLVVSEIQQVKEMVKKGKKKVKDISK